MRSRLRSLSKSTRRVLACVLAAALVALGLLAFLAPQPEQPLTAPPTSSFLMESAMDLDEIYIFADFQPEKRSLEVTHRFKLLNRNDATLDTAVFRAYPNAFQSEETSPIATEEMYDACYPRGFSSGALSISSVMAGLGGNTLQPALHRYLDSQKTALSVELPHRWEPGISLTVDFQYTIYVPSAASRFGANNGIWALGNAFLLPAPFEDGAYRVDPYYAVGDPFVSDCANYYVSIDMPTGYVCAASAWPLAMQVGSGITCYAFEALAVRDFALCLSDRYHTAQAMEGEVLVTVYAGDAARAGTALRYARQALSCFEARYGAYPYPAFTLAEVDFPFGGMEYPGLVMLGAAEMEKGGEDLEWIVAHETAHQWWYGVVGSDQVNQAWQDEALCEYAVLDYAETRYGAARREELRFSRVETAMRLTLPRGATPGSPLDYFGSISEYSLVVYQRGAALLCALNEALGGKLDDFLHLYYDENQFARVTRGDFEASLRAFSGEDWSPLIVDYLDTYLTN